RHADDKALEAALGFRIITPCIKHPAQRPNGAKGGCKHITHGKCRNPEQGQVQPQLLERILLYAEDFLEFRRPIGFWRIDLIFASRPTDIKGDDEVKRHIKQRYEGRTGLANIAETGGENIPGIDIHGTVSHY